MNYQEAQAQWRSDVPHLEARGVFLPEVTAYLPEEFKRDYTLAMDAQPTLQTAPNSAVPALFTTMVDPAVFRILFAPSKAAEIIGEQKKGTWVDDTIMFPTIEHVGEVTSYGDYAESGHTGVNANWPQRQSYLFQTVKEYGERELDRAGAAKINWVSEIDVAATTVIQKFRNLTYFFGVQGLQNYGLLNDPALPASLTPSTKTETGVKWIFNGVPVAANEIYADIEALFIQLVSQTAGLVDRETSMVLAMSPQSEAALTATNSFNVNVYDLLKKNFPNIKIISAVQYGVLSASNPQGVAAGNLIQLIALNIEGQDTGFTAYSELMRSHPIIRAMSSFKQKVTSGTWGAVLRMPVAFSSMVGV
jgi:hypothetical protein